MVFRSNPSKKQKIECSLNISVSSIHSKNGKYHDTERNIYNLRTMDRQSSGCNKARTRTFGTCLIDLEGQFSYSLKMNRRRS